MDRIKESFDSLPIAACFFDENGAAYPVWQALEKEAGRYLK